MTIPWSEIGGADVDLILPNDDSLSYVKVAFDDQSLAAALSNTVAEPLSRSVISGQLWQMTYDGLLSPTQYAQFIDNEPLLSSASLLAQRTRSALSALRNFTNIARREADLNDFFDQALRARDLAEPGSDPHTIWTRTIALVGAYLPQRDDDIAFVLEHTTDQDLRWMLLSARAVAGTVSPAVLDDELASSGSASDVVAHLKAMTSLPGKRKDTLERLLHDKLSNDHLSAMIDGFTQYVHRAEASQALPDYFDKIEAIWASRSQELAERLIYGLYPFSDLLPGERPEDNTDVKAATRWLDESLDAPPALRKIILDQRDFHLRSLRNQMR